MLAVDKDSETNHKTIINAVPEIKELKVPEFELSPEAKFMIDTPSNEQKNAYIIESLDKLAQQSKWNTDVLCEINKEIRTTNQHVNNLEIWYISHKDRIEQSLKLTKIYEKYLSERTWLSKVLTTGMGRLFTIISGILAILIMYYELLKYLQK